MNKKLNIIIAMFLAVAGVFSLTSCKEDEPAIAKAVLCSVFSLQYDADGGEQEVKVVSDALWHVEAPEWVTVSPTEGSGTTFVTITVDKNYSGGTMDRPRQENVVFKGNTKASEAVVAIYQAGDKYKGVVPCDAATFYGYAEDEVVIVKDMTVTAYTAEGFLATDGKTNLQANIAEKPAIGTTVSVAGTKSKNKSGMALIVADYVTVGGAAATVPAAVDITANLDKYTSESMTYVKLNGLMDNAGVITVEGMEYNGLATGIEGLNLTKFGGHIVNVEGYYAGTVKPNVNIIVAAVEDLGVFETVYFFEDFEWLEPWSSQKPAGRTVEDNNSDATAQQLGTNKVDDVSTYDALLAKGYEFPFCCAPGKDPRKPQAQSYLQRNYLKFGLTAYYTGLTLPTIKDIPSGAQLVISFDYCKQRQGSGKWDDTDLVIIVKNGDDEVQYKVPYKQYVDGQNYEWTPVTIELTGAVVTEKTRITIRNCDEQWPDESGRALRFYLDNIKITEK